MKLLVSTVLLALFALPLAAQQSSLGFTVSPGPDPTADFEDLQVAIDTVAPGSTLILLPGHHDNQADFFVIDGKELRLMGTDPFGFVPTSARLEVRNLQAGQEVSVYGLRSGMQTDDLQDLAQLWAHDCEGALFVQGCDLHAPDGTFTLGTTIGLELEDVESATFVECTIRGSYSWPYTTTRIAGDTRAVFHGCNIVGESYYFFGGCVGCEGCACNSGFWVEDGAQAWTYAGTSTGGSCESDVEGCTGAVVQAGGRLTSRGTLFINEAPDSIFPVVKVAEGGVYVDESEMAPVRSLFVPTIVGASSSFPVTLAGQPGDLAWVYLGSKSLLLPLEGLSSVLGIEAPVLLYGGVTTDASGFHSTTLTTPSLPSGEILQGYLQGLCIPTAPGADPAAVLTGPRLVIVLG